MPNGLPRCKCGAFDWLFLPIGMREVRLTCRQCWCAIVRSSPAARKRAREIQRALLAISDSWEWGENNAD